MCLHKGSSTAPTSFESLPVEIIREILIHVPFPGCQAIAMASKHHLAPTLYRDLNFARQHFRHQDAVSNFAVMWDFVSKVCSSRWNAGGPLQETYVAIVHAELFAAEDFTIVWYPTVSGPVAFRIMKSLLSFHHFDPTCQNNKPIRWAAQKGHLQAVQLLLAQPQVNPSDEGNKALEHAYPRLTLTKYEAFSCLQSTFLSISHRGERNQVFKFLLADDRVDPSDNNNTLLAFLLGRLRNLRDENEMVQEYTELLNILLDHPKTDPKYDNYAMIHWAVRNKRRALVKRLLSDPRVVPPSHKDEFKNRCPLIVASGLGLRGAVLMLLTDPNIDPTTNNSECLVRAHKNGWTETVFYLLRDGRVNAEASLLTSILKKACFGGSKVLAQRVLNYRSFPEVLTESDRLDIVRETINCGNISLWFKMLAKRKGVIVSELMVVVVQGNADGVTREMVEAVSTDEFKVCLEAAEQLNNSSMVERLEHMKG